jgi:hypothetical protein
MIIPISISGTHLSAADYSIFRFHFNSILQINKTDLPKSAAELSEVRIPWHDIQENASELSLLSWHTKFSEFFGYDDQLSELERWIVSKPAISVKFITGAGGVGKSRLGAEFAQKLLDEKWSAGFVNLNHPVSVPLSEQGTLLIIDYPEENKSRVKELLQDLSAMRNIPRLRILFLSRQTLDVWNDIIFESNAMNLVDTVPINLRAIDSVAVHGMYNSALDKFSNHYGTCPPPLSEEQISEWLKLASENDRPLFVIATALYSAQNPKEEVVKYTGREIVNAIADREIARLTRLADDCGAKDHYLFACLLAMAAIAGELPINRIEELIKKEELPLQFPSNKDIESELKTSGIYEEGKIPAPKPDIVAAAFTVKVLYKKDRFAPELLWVALENDLRGGLERVSRLSYNAEVDLQLRNDTISGFFEKAVGTNPDRCAEISEFFECTTPLCLSKVAITIWKTLFMCARTNQEKAICLSNMANEQHAIGDNDGALKAQRKVERFFCQLASINPDNYEDAWAQSLNNLSIYLDFSGELTDALDKSRKSVEILRRLSIKLPDRYEPELAASLINLSNRLSNAGDTAAYDANKEAEAIYRRLIVQNPALYKPKLANILLNISYDYSAQDDIDGALKASEEAVAIYRRLANKNRALYEPELAVSLINWSLDLSNAGFNEEALSAINEAIGIFRPIANLIPRRYIPDLAKILGTLARIQLHTGNLEKATEAAKEGMEILEAHKEKYSENPYKELLENLKLLLRIIQKST